MAFYVKSGSVLGNKVASSYQQPFSTQKTLRPHFVGWRSSKIISDNIGTCILHDPKIPLYSRLFKRSTHMFLGGGCPDIISNLLGTGNPPDPKDMFANTYNQEPMSAQKRSTHSFLGGGAPRIISNYLGPGILHDPKKYP